jgi:hypothetical protein
MTETAKWKNKQQKRNHKWKGCTPRRTGPGRLRRAGTAIRERRDLLRSFSAATEQNHSKRMEGEKLAASYEHPQQSPLKKAYLVPKYLVLVVVPLGCWTGAPLQHSHEHTNREKRTQEQKKRRTRNPRNTTQNSMICSQNSHRGSQRRCRATPRRSSPNLNWNSLNQRNPSKNEFFSQKEDRLGSWCTSGIDSNHLVGLFITRQSINRTKQISLKNSNRAQITKRKNRWTVTREKRKPRKQSHHISTSRGHREVKASLPTAKSQITQPRISVVDLSQEVENETLGRRGEWRSGREVRRQGAAILYLTGLFYIPLNAPGYIRAKLWHPKILYYLKIDKLI